MAREVLGPHVITHGPWPARARLARGTWPAAATGVQGLRVDGSLPRWAGGELLGSYGHVPEKERYGLDCDRLPGQSSEGTQRCCAPKRTLPLPPVLPAL